MQLLPVSWSLILVAPLVWLLVTLACTLPGVYFILVGSLILLNLLGFWIKNPSQKFLWLQVLAITWLYIGPGIFLGTGVMILKAIFGISM